MLTARHCASPARNLRIPPLVSTTFPHVHRRGTCFPLLFLLLCSGGGGCEQIAALLLAPLLLLPRVALRRCHEPLVKAGPCGAHRNIVLDNRGPVSLFLWNWSVLSLSRFIMALQQLEQL